MKISRSVFLKTMGITTTVALTGSRAFATKRRVDNPPVVETNLKLGLASYTLRKLALDDVIKVSKRLGLTYLALKSVHMPLESSGEEIRSIAQKVRAAGLTLYGGGVIYMKTKQEADAAFQYAANAGLEMIIGVPNHDLLPQVNDLVKKYNIKLAIHNHGPGDDLYSSPNDVHARIKDLDKRIGFCMDIGHVVRIGEDPVPMLEKYKDRIYDMHMKDMDKAEPEGKPVEIGRGVINIPQVVTMLKKIKYQGYVGFEHEKDADDPVAGLAESVGYVRGVSKVV